MRAAGPRPGRGPIGPEDRLLSLWIREIIGWLLVLIGLGCFLICFGRFLVENLVIEAGVMATMGAFIFRGGIHLVKVATAARVVLAARKAGERAA